MNRLNNRNIRQHICIINTTVQYRDSVFRGAVAMLMNGKASSITVAVICLLVGGAVAFFAVMAMKERNTTAGKLRNTETAIELHSIQVAVEKYAEDHCGNSAVRHDTRQKLKRKVRRKHSLKSGSASGLTWFQIRCCARGTLSLIREIPS